MKRCLAAFRWLTLCVLLTASPFCVAEDDCFPPDSTFARIDCACEGRSSQESNDMEFTIDCFTNDVFDEFPVLNSTYPGVVAIKAPKQEFTELRKEHLAPFPNVKEIDFSRGRISRIYNDVFEGNPEITELLLNDNRLTDFPPVRGLTKMKLLFVEDNDIQSLEPGDLDQCYSLFHLEANNNDIKKLKYGVFRDQCNLGILDLRNNRRLTIEGDVFENTVLTDLNLQNTAIDHLPSKGLRQFLRELDMSGTRNLKRFDAYESGIQFNNQTYPLLEKVEFFYHAHCCQMQDHHYFVVGRRRQMEERSDHLVSTADLNTGDYKREASDSMDGYVCVNTTDRNVVNVNNATDFQIQSASEFCTSANCIASLCGEGCMLSTEELSSAMGITEIICIEIVPSSSLDTYYSSESFSSQITRNVCNTTPLSVIPSPSVSPSMSPAIPPPPPDPCVEPQAWCMYQYTGIDVDSCDTCASLCIFFDHCMDDFPEVCDCFKRKRSAYNRNSPRAKRAINDTSELECSLSVTDVVCRKRLNCTTVSMSSYTSPTPTPTSSPSLLTNTSQRCDHEYSIGQLLLPSGWFYPDPDSQDTICREASENVTTEPEPTPTPTVPSTVSPPNECVRNPGIVTIDITRLVEGMVTECSPEPNDFNPCEELLGNSDVLRVVIWFVVLLALFGNGLVIIVFVGYSVIIRRTKMNLFIMHFFYANLAVADLLMSIYLLTIAAVDAHTLGHFSEEDVEWRTGPGCGFAGFCAITSTMVSVYTLVVITAERLYTITCVMHKKNITKPIALVIMIVGWVFGICVGMLPLVGVNSYELVAICLPFDTTTTSSLVYVTFLLIITGLAFIFIAFSYGIIFYQVVLSPSKRKLVRSGGQQKKWKGELKMALRMFLLVFTNFVCWFPIALVSLTAAFGAPLNGISVGTAKVFVVFVFPLNACVNPFLYTLSTKAFKENFLIMLSKCGLFKNTAQSAVQSRVLGFPTKSLSTSDARRSSIFSRLISFSTFNPNRRESDISQGDMYNSVQSRRRSSQFSMSSNEDGLAVHPTVQGSPFNIRSNEDQFNLTLPNPGFRDGQDRPRHGFPPTSLSILPELEEVPVESPDPSIRVNPGYSDQDNIQVECEQQEQTTEFNNGHLINGDVDSVTMIENELTEPSITHHQIVADVLPTEQGEHSDSPSTPDEAPVHSMRTEENNQEQ